MTKLRGLFVQAAQDRMRRMTEERMFPTTEVQPSTYTYADLQAAIDKAAAMQPEALAWRLAYVPMWYYDELKASLANDGLAMPGGGMPAARLQIIPREGLTRWGILFGGEPNAAGQYPRMSLLELVPPDERA